MHDLQTLTAFVEAARAGSFTEAARRLGVSVASISRAIVRLEARLGVRLFARTTRQLKLTGEGSAYLLDVTAALDRLAMADERLSSIGGHARGRVRLSVPSILCEHYILPELHGFFARYPDVDLDIHVQEAGDDPVVGGYDLVVQIERPTAETYIARMLGNIFSLLVASPDYMARAGIPRSIADLAAHQRIRFSATPDSMFAWHILKGDRLEIHPPQGRLWLSGNYDACISAAVAGFGISLCDVGSVMPFLLSGQLKIVLPDHRCGEVPLHLVYPHREQLPQRTRVVIDFMVGPVARRLTFDGYDLDRFAA